MVSAERSFSVARQSALRGSEEIRLLSPSPAAAPPPSNLKIPESKMACNSAPLRESAIVKLYALHNKISRAAL